MTWIDDRLAQRQAEQERQRKIFAGSEPLFRGLWTEIEALATEASGKGFKLWLEGSDVLGRSSFEHRITMATATPGGPADLTISVNREKGLIVAKGDNVNVRFTVDIGEDGNVCLKRADGKEVSLITAAIDVLDPFLFPDLR